MPSTQTSLFWGQFVSHPPFWNLAIGFLSTAILVLGSVRTKESQNYGYGDYGYGDYGSGPDESSHTIPLVVAGVLTLAFSVLHILCWFRCFGSIAFSSLYSFCYCLVFAGMWIGIAIYSSINYWWGRQIEIWSFALMIILLLVYLVYYSISVAAYSIYRGGSVRVPRPAKSETQSIRLHTPPHVAAAAPDQQQPSSVPDLASNYAASPSPPTYRTVTGPGPSTAPLHRRERSWDEEVGARPRKGAAFERDGADRDDDLEFMSRGA